MELLGPEGTAESGTEDYELPLQPDGETPAETSPREAALGDELLVDLGAEADSDADAGERESPNGVAPAEEDEPLPAGLLQLSHEDGNEAPESTAASELPDIPIQELLNELVSLSRSLGIERPVAGAEPDSIERHPAGAEPTTEEDSAEPERSPDLEAEPPLVGPRRHALLGLLVCLTLTMAIASVLMSADHIIGNVHDRDLSPPPIATTYPAVAVRQVHSGQPTVEPTPGATPAPTATRQPAYFIYTVQRGDTLTAIAAAFGISLDHILWTNPEVIDDPNLLLVGEKLLIPNVAGMIYHIKPGDILSVIGRVLPNQGTDHPGHPQIP